MEEWGSEMVGRYWCMACEPYADPIRDILIPKPCVRHDAMPKGADDDAVRAPAVSLGMGLDAEGDICRAFAAWQRQRDAA